MIRLLTHIATRGETIDSDVLQNRISQLVNFDFNYIQFQLILVAFNIRGRSYHKVPITCLISSSDQYRNRCFLEKMHREGFITIVPDMEDRTAVEDAFHYLRKQVWDEFKISTLEI
jgi:hypothetical protein